MGTSERVGTGPHLVGTVEAARILGRRPRTVQRWAQLGKLPVAVQMPGVTGAALFDRTAVEALAASEAAATKASAA